MPTHPSDSARSVPVLMYHSVGRVLADWAWSELTTPAAVFESHLRALARAGYQAVSLERWHEHVTGARPLTGKSIVLTFDDGYVDNWTYVVPLLERYGFSGTVLATVEFVDPRPVVRPTLRDAWDGTAREEEIDVRGFMSWEELRRGAERGVLEVQSHAYTHTWYPVSDEVVDFHHPGDGHYWLDWNQDAARKPAYLEAPRASRVPWGVPVYRHEKALACRRYFPDAREAEHCASWVERNGGEALFASPDWRERLRAEWARFRASAPPTGRIESDDERFARLEHELGDSRRALESGLGRPVNFLVWPGGGYDEDAMRIARTHYRAVTMSGPERGRYRNRPGENPGMIIRRGAPTIEVGKESHYAPGSYVVDFIEEFARIPGARRRRQVRKLGYLAAARLGLWPR